MPVLNITALILTIIGGVNWLLVGIADFSLVDAIFGAGSTLARAVYVIVGIAALYCLTFIPHVSNERDGIPST